MNVLKTSVAVAAMLMAVVPTADAQRGSSTGRGGGYPGGPGVGRIGVGRTMTAPGPSSVRSWSGAQRYAVPRVFGPGRVATVGPAGRYRYGMAAAVGVAPSRFYGYGAQRSRGVVVVGHGVPRVVVA